MNLIEISKKLKFFTDNQLLEAMQHPSGQLPGYLVMAELNRRKEARPNDPPKTTVMQDLAQMLPQQVPTGQMPGASFEKGGRVESRPDDIERIARARQQEADTQAYWASMIPESDVLGAKVISDYQYNPPVTMDERHFATRRALNIGPFSGLRNMRFDDRVREGLSDAPGVYGMTDANVATRGNPTVFISPKNMRNYAGGVGTQNHEFGHVALTPIRENFEHDTDTSAIPLEHMVINAMRAQTGLSKEDREYAIQQLRAQGAQLNGLGRSQKGEYAKRAGNFIDWLQGMKPDEVPARNGYLNSLPYRRVDTAIMRKDIEKYNHGGGVSGGHSSGVRRMRSSYATGGIVGPGDDPWMNYAESPVLIGEPGVPEPIGPATGDWQDYVQLAEAPMSVEDAARLGKEDRRRGQNPALDPRNRVPINPFMPGTHNPDQWRGPFNRGTMEDLADQRRRELEGKAGIKPLPLQPPISATDPVGPPPAALRKPGEPSTGDLPGSAPPATAYPGGVPDPYNLIRGPQKLFPNGAPEARPGNGRTSSGAAAPNPTGSTWHWQQNNPGNIRMTEGSLKAYPGAKPGANGFLAFDTPEQGLAAIDQTWRNIARTRGVTTPREIISIYAPKGDGANDPDAYAAQFQKLTGIDPDKPIDMSDAATMQKVRAAVAQIETGTSGPSSPAGSKVPTTVAQGRDDEKRLDSYLAKYTSKENPYADLQRRLDEIDSRRSKREDTNLNMALINAGLGMMANKSPYPLVAAGEAGLNALKGYREDTKNLREDEMLNLSAAAKLKEAEMAYKRGDKQLAFEYLREANTNRRHAETLALSPKNDRQWQIFMEQYKHGLTEQTRLKDTINKFKADTTNYMMFLGELATRLKKKPEQLTEQEIDSALRSRFGDTSTSASSVAPTKPGTKEDPLGLR